MPGFPTSSLVVFDAFIRPMLWRLGGEVGRQPWPPAAPLAWAPRIARSSGARTTCASRSTNATAALWADPLRGGSATLSNVVRADALVCVPAATPALAAGDAVEVLLY